MDILNHFTDDQIALAACGLAVLVGFGLIALFRENMIDVSAPSSETSSADSPTQPASSAPSEPASVSSPSDPSSQRAA